MLEYNWVLHVIATQFEVIHICNVFSGEVHARGITNPLRCHLSKLRTGSFVHFFQ